MAVIRIKRGTGTTAPSSLKTAELGYAMGTGTQANGGDRLYFGKGDDGSGNATSIVVIGGEYFTGVLAHAAGTLTASAAIITDASSKIDNLKVDNLDLNGNTISSTDTNGNVTLDPNGTGVVDVSTSKISNVVDPAADQDAATKKYVDDQFGGSAALLNIAADTGSADEVSAASTVTFTGDTGISTTVSDNEITIDLDDTAVTPASYGSSTAIPIITVDQQGRLTAASTATVSTSLALAGETGTGTVNLIDSSFSIVGGTGIATSASGNEITVTTVDAEIVHDDLSGFVADEHVAHSGVTITAGDGLTGGGTIAATRTLAIGEGTGITVSANAIATNDGEIVHDSLSGFVASEHINHGGVSIVAGTGLTGGGNIEATRTLNVIGGDGITANADEIEVAVDNSTVELSATSGSGVVRVKDGGITNAKLANDSLTIGTTEIDLGASSTVLAGLTQIDVDNIRILDNTVASSTGTLFLDPNPIDSDGGEVIVRGNFTVQGTTTTVNSTTVSINDLNMVLADSAANAAAADGAGLTVGGAGYSGTRATFTYNGSTDEWEMNKKLNLPGSGSLEFGGVSLLETIDDHLASNLLQAGEGIDLTYSDGSNTLTIAAELATISNPGVASFDSDEFTITSGAVILDTIDGGTF